MLPEQGEAIDALRRLLSAGAISAEPEVLAEASTDMLRRSRGSPVGLPDAVTPLAIVSPSSTHDVAAVVRFAAERRIPLVELGGGTGLMGGARSTAPGIVLDLRDMDRVLEINHEDRTLRVQAGAVLGRIDDALAAEGLMLGHDPWTVPVATIGGAISTNGLGYRGARYGSMGDQVLGLEVVLGDGRVLTTRPVARSSTGPQLKRLFVGAEGTLGVITEAVLRVFPLPERRLLHALEFPDFDDGFRAIEALFAVGLVPAMVDFGQTYAGERDVTGPFTPAGAPGRLQLAFEGAREEAEAASARALAMLTAAGGRLLPQADADDFWQERHVVAERLRRRQDVEQESWLPADVSFDFIHVALPASRVLPFRTRATSLLLAAGVSVVEWGLWNQPELFSIAVQKKVRSDADRLACAGAVDAVLQLAQDLGGSMEYVHGAGVRLAALMQREHGAGLELLRAIKRVVDPNNILNPGKLGL